MALVKKTYTVTADAETLAKFETFLALLHYNGGHSNYFGMAFDGDGSDRLKVDPPPDESLRPLVNKIGDSPANVEVALLGTYKGVHVDFDRGHYVVDRDGKMRFVRPNITA